MKKRTIALFVIALLAIQSVVGQIILTEEDVGINQRLEGDPDIGVMVPLQNSNLDQWKENYIPLGNGLFLLVGLGGGYLFKKKIEDRRKK